MKTKSRLALLECEVESLTNRVEFLEKEYRRTHPWQKNKMDDD